MKWPMKLRTRLFLSISALVTVALLGLLLGLFSVLQMAALQQHVVKDTTYTLELALKLRQNLGEQLNLILDEDTTPNTLVTLQDQFQTLLDQGLEQGGERTGLSKAASNYQAFVQAYRQSPSPARSMGVEQPLAGGIVARPADERGYRLFHLARYVRFALFHQSPLPGLIRMIFPVG